jgi:hypothetical protein
MEGSSLGRVSNPRQKQVGIAFYGNREFNMRYKEDYKPTENAPNKDK